MNAQNLEPTFSIEYINAAKAQEYLLKNRPYEPGTAGTNRRVRLSDVNKWAVAMLRGEWILIHQGIAFDENDIMVDGQQRMRAILKASTEGAIADGELLPAQPDISLPFTVARNFNPNTMGVVDTGRNRSMADFLAMQGHTYTTVSAAALKLIHAYMHVPYQFTHWHRHTLSPHQQREMMDKHGAEVTESIRIGYGLYNIYPMKSTGAALFLCRRYRPDLDIEEFLRLAKEGSDRSAQEGDPRWKLHILYTNMRMRRIKMSPVSRFAVFLKAFNGWAMEERWGNDRSLSFRPNANEAFPRIVGPDGKPIKAE